MRAKQPTRAILAMTLAWLLAVPVETRAQAAQHAGQVSLVVPSVHVERGQQQLPAVAHTPVYWNDVVGSELLGRARVELDDGSVLNVGSNSSLRIAKHDAGTQQSELDLDYGRIRARVVKLVKPHSGFEIRSPIGTTGVVGTDYFLAFESNILRLIVFEGVVRFCNLAGVCIDVAAGMMSTLRGGLAPDQPVPTPQADLTDAIASTDVPPQGGEARKPPTHHSPWIYIAIAGAMAAPAFLLPAIGTKRQTCTAVAQQIAAGPPGPPTIVCH